MEVIQLGNYLDDTEKKFKNPQAGRVYSSEGISPCLDTCGGGNREVKIMEPKIIKEGNYSPSNHNASSIVSGEGIAPTVIENHGTVTAVKLPAETICINSKVDGKQPSLEHRIYDSRGIATASTSSFHPNIAIPQATKQGYIEVEPGGVFDGAYPESTTRRGRVQEGGKVAPTLCTSNELSVYEGVKNQEFRIRKLTPRECFRLMGVSEENIDTIQAAGISNSQQYKMAGNSIVVDVLYYIFKKMFIDKENDNTLLTLF
jgi:DNA (cytosine-5)-methyltransferase 1